MWSWHDSYKIGAKFNMKKIFLVDDKFTVLLALSRWFSSKGCYVRTFSKSKPLFDALHESLPDIIVMETNLHDEDGNEIYRQIETEFAGKIHILQLSAISNKLKEAENNRTDYFFSNPAIPASMTYLLNSCTVN